MQRFKISVKFWSNEAKVMQKCEISVKFDQMKPKWCKDGNFPLNFDQLKPKMMQRFEIFIKFWSIEAKKNYVKEKYPRKFKSSIYKSHKADKEATQSFKFN